MVGNRGSPKPAVKVRRAPAAPPLEERGAAWTPERLHARFASRIARQVRAMLQGDEEADDVVQEVLITVVAEVGRLRDPRSIDHWVAQITRAQIFRLFRHRRPRRHESLEALPERMSPTVQVDLDARELASRAMKVLEIMPPRERALLVAWWFSPGTHGSLAARFGWTVVTFKRRLARAKTRFAKLARRDPALAGETQNDNLEARFDTGSCAPARAACAPSGASRLTRRASAADPPGAPCPAGGDR
jgi:RNA polymerase sigma factor (sigma-70 family)